MALDLRGPRGDALAGDDGALGGDGGELVGGDLAALHVVLERAVEEGGRHDRLLEVGGGGLGASPAPIATRATAVAVAVAVAVAASRRTERREWIGAAGDAKDMADLPHRGATVAPRAR
ncbi:hypothetical protein [Clavibacter michiganensis]|uniref:hypothetical protein n=1 Tax=Clavibacter michiganensis TaxID=28447 RepID=UPI0011B1DE8E|nr:hypothetical protein [Clavibacter michiganensis]